MKKIISVFMMLVMLMQCSFSSAFAVIAVDETGEQEAEVVETGNDSEIIKLIPCLESNSISETESMIVTFESTAELSYVDMEFEGINVSLVNAELLQFRVSAEDYTANTEESNEEDIGTFGKLVVSASTSDGKTIYGTLYTYQEDGYLYLSELSYDYAWYYSKEAMLNGRGLLDELKKACEDIYGTLFGSDIESTVAISDSNSNNSDKVTIEGHIDWEYNDTSDTLPLKIAKVEVRKKNLVGSSYIAEGYTDKDGNFSIEANANDIEDNKIFIRVLLEANTFKVRLDWVITNYYYNADQIENVSGGDVVTYNCKIQYKDSAVYKATYVHQAMTISERFAVLLGFDPSEKLRVAYPAVSLEYEDEEGKKTYGLNKMAFCYKNVAAIGIDSYNNTDMIAHEYSHFIQGSMGNYGADLIDIALHDPRHASSDEQYEKKENKKFAMHLTWSEGWGEVFSTMAQKYYADEYYKLKKYSSEVLISSDDCTGEFQEDAIKAFLWSLVDIRKTKDILDYQLPWTVQEWWDMTTVEGTCRLPDFINVIENQASAELKKGIAEKLSIYNIAPKISSAIYNSSNLKNPPTINMIMNGSEEHPNNKYKIQIFSSDLELLTETDAVAVTIGNLTPFSVTIPTNVWNKAIGGFECGEKVKMYVSVRGYRVDDDEDDGFEESGPYSSAYFEINGEMSHDYSKYAKYDDSYHVKICQGCGEHENDNNKISHNFVSYTRYDKTYHIGTCQNCGYQKKAMHYARINDSDSGSLKRCADCGSPLDSGGIFPVTPFMLEDLRDDE